MIAFLVSIPIFFWGGGGGGLGAKYLRWGWGPPPPPRSFVHVAAVAFVPSHDVINAFNEVADLIRNE